MIEKPVKDVTDAIANSFDAFADDITYSLSSVDKELFALKLTHQSKFKMLDSYVTIIIGNDNQEYSHTELELLISYQSDENI